MHALCILFLEEGVMDLDRIARSLITILKNSRIVVNVWRKLPYMASIVFLLYCSENDVGLLREVVERSISDLGISLRKLVIRKVTRGIYEEEKISSLHLYFLLAKKMYLMSDVLKKMPELIPKLLDNTPIGVVKEAKIVRLVRADDAIFLSKNGSVLDPLVWAILREWKNLERSFLNIGFPESSILLGSYFFGGEAPLDFLVEEISNNMGIGVDNVVKGLHMLEQLGMLNITGGIVTLNNHGEKHAREFLKILDRILLEAYILALKYVKSEHGKLWLFLKNQEIYVLHENGAVEKITASTLLLRARGIASSSMVLAACLLILALLQVNQRVIHEKLLRHIIMKIEKLTEDIVHRS